MKAKVPGKAVRHAKPFRKVTHGKKQARAAAAPNKKEAVENVAAEPEMFVATYEAPIEFVQVDLQPEVDMIEIFEVTLPGNEGEA